MKKNFVYAMMSAIALSGAVSLTSCSSNEEVTEVNPTFDGNSVRTDFAFNITKASQSTTRMTAANTQENGQPFLGIEHMYLFPFEGVPADNKTSHLSFASSDYNPSASNKNFSLGAIESAELYTSATGPSKKIYSLSMPIGTDNFLFYGKAIRGNKNGFEAGRLTSSFYNADNTKVTGATGADAVANTNDITFSLVGIASGLGTDATDLAAYLTRIAQTTGWAETVSTVQNHSGSNPDAYSSLADLYAKFTHINSDRCGSAEAIKRTVIDLYKSAKAINKESSVTEVQTIANAICASIVNAGYSLRMTVTDTATDPEDWTFAWVGLTNENFPANLNLPIGAAQLNFASGTKTFSYKSVVAPGTTMVSGVDYTAICYPSELVYFDNSPLRATDVYKTPDDYASNTQAWDIQYQAPASGDDWRGTKVQSTTRAVAMQNNVNYGVAMLESTIQLTASDPAALVDNRAAVLGGSAENQIDINGNLMTVTGILIGGQPGTVGWNMVKTSSAGFDHVIYDHNVQYTAPLSAYISAKSVNNYTIVLDNYTAGTQAEVKIALELVNGDKDFYGQNGMIPAGHTFYLIGSLSPSTYSSSNPRVVPYVKTGAGDDDKVLRTASSYRITEEGTGRVFLQDYKTIANITIGTNSLQKAYSSIPDLRSTELLFGLSVDLTWEQGFTYNVNL